MESDSHQVDVFRVIHADGSDRVDGIKTHPAEQSFIWQQFRNNTCDNEGNQEELQHANDVDGCANAWVTANS